MDPNICLVSNELRFSKQNLDFTGHN
jgi:hypothetical protein